MTQKKVIILWIVVLLSITNPLHLNIALATGITEKNEISLKSQVGFFTENKGQWDPAILFMGDTGFGRVALTQEGILYQMIKVNEVTYETQTIKYSLVSPQNLKIKCIDLLPHYNHYFLGKDPTKWTTNCRNYAEIVYENVWEGIDLSFFFTPAGFQYKYHIKPFAKIGRLKFHLEGGDMTFPSSNREIPKEKDQKYLADSLVYSTFLSGGSSLEDCAEDIAVDDMGCAYITGQATCPDFPTTPGAVQIKYRGNGDTFVAKLNPSGSELVYSTYLGGERFDQLSGQNIHSIALDKEGSAYVTCFTNSADFPTTEGAFQSKRKGEGDAFVTKLSPDGSKLVYSTYLGGSGNDCTFGIAVDELGCAFVCGFTISRFNDINDFPTTQGALQEKEYNIGDGFLTKLNPEGTSLSYSTYLGGCFDDYAQDIALDKAGNAYVCLWTFSTDFIVSQNAYQRAYTDNGDIVLLKLNTALSGTPSLIYSTYLGGLSHDKPFAIAVDNQFNAYVTGITSNLDFPTTKNAFQTTRKGEKDAFVIKLNPKGTDVIYSTYLGGSDWDCGYDILSDDVGNAYITGYTRMDHFPTTPTAFQPTSKGFGDAFITKLNPYGTDAIYSSYLGGCGIDSGFGITVDKKEGIYLTGGTSAMFNTNFINDFPSTKGAFQPMRKGDGSAFVTKLKIGRLLE